MHLLTVIAVAATLSAEKEDAAMTIIADVVNMVAVAETANVVVAVMKNTNMTLTVDAVGQTIALISTVTHLVALLIMFVPIASFQLVMATTIIKT